ncbi:hypothetical protein BH10ACI4_BH10ACI4_33640 [soil metagenome]
MFRSTFVGVMLLGCVLPGFSQSEASTSLEKFFEGKEVVMKIDMPGTQKGVDLNYKKPVPMDWKEYSSRIKSNGIAIHKGEVVRVTKFVVKNDMIEFQVAGGGFGSFGDDSSTTVAPNITRKSQYERDLEDQISRVKDSDQKRRLERDLARVRSRRQQMDADNQNAAMVASQIKAQQVAQNRLGGGSRFNLRWQGSIPPDDRNPEAIMQLLSEYVDFQPAPAGGGAPPVAAAAGAGVSATQLKRGMTLDEVSRLLGQGKVVSQTVSADGLKTQLVEYATPDSVVDATFVEGVMVRYSMSSN